MAKTEDRARDPQAAVLDLLSDFKGLDPVKELFWKELNYERINEPISRRGWTENAAKSLTDDPIVFAGGGENNDFKIILARLDSDHVRLGLQRPVISRLLRDFPYALFVFSNRDRNAWHFVNVKYDDDPKRRQLFRRISVAPGDRLRTASERMAMLDLQAIGDQASSLVIHVLDGQQRLTALCPASCGDARFRKALVLDRRICAIENGAFWEKGRRRQSRDR